MHALKEDLETDRQCNAGGDTAWIDTYVPLKLKKISGDSHPPAGEEQALTPAQALEKYRILLITGTVGSGKTTLLKHLSLTYCTRELETQNAGIPILIKLRDFSGGRRRLRNCIDSIFEKYGCPKAKKITEKYLESGKCLLMLDGLDELPDSKHRERAVKAIKVFSQTYPQCRILVTCRTALYNVSLEKQPLAGELFAGFTPMEIVQLAPGLVRQFIANRFTDSQCCKSDALWDMLLNNGNITPLAGNPLMLSIFASEFDISGKKAPKRASIYKRIVEVLLIGRDAQKGIVNRFPVDKKAYILGKIACRNHKKHRRTISRSDILEEIARHMPLLGTGKRSMEPLLDEIIMRSCLLAESSPGFYEFLHLSFQEYFTARELLTREKGIVSVLPHLSESWWEGPILFYAGLSPNTSPLIQRIKEEVPEDIFHNNLLLSGKCIVDGRFTDPLLKETITRELWRLYNDGEYQLLREKAMEILSRVKPQGVIRELSERLTHQDSHVRRFAVETLGLIGSSETLPALFMVLARDTDDGIRCHAAEALGKMVAPEVVRPLMQTLHRDKSSEVRRSAANALASFKGEEVTTALLEALTLDRDKTVRAGAAEAVGNAGDTGAVSSLISALTNERNGSVRWRIAIAIGKLKGTDARSILIEALSTDKDSEVRESAAEALGLIGSEECVTALVTALSSDKSADVRGSAAYALGLIENAEAVPPLIKALVTDSNSEVRGRAAYALGRIESSKAIPYLAVVFNVHKESIIRGNAAYALGKIGGETSMSFLIQALTTDKDPYVRYRAAEVLGNIGNVMSIQPLKTALKDNGSYYGWEVKNKAYEALEKISRRLQVKILMDPTGHS